MIQVSDYKEKIRLVKQTSVTEECFVDKKKDVILDMAVATKGCDAKARIFVVFCTFPKGFRSLRAQTAQIPYGISSR